MKLSDIYKGNLTWLVDRTILLVRSGSHAYGLNTPESDLDLKGVAVPPPEYFLGFMHNFEQTESKDPYDMTIYGIRKFFKLAADCNPNIIEVLWGDEDDVLEVSQEGRMLLEHRELFLSKKAKHTFSGYAVAQLKRIRTHRRWLLNPPTHKPARREFDLQPKAPLAKDEIHALEVMIERNEGDVTSLPPNVMGWLEREKKYRTAKREWEQYQNWKANRNPDRAELERKHGLDTKHAMHLVRLLRMCREILTEGHVIVRRPDRDELLAVRRGEWSYDRIVGWAEEQDKELDELAATSELPKSPDRHKLDELCIEIVEYINSGN